MTEDKTHGRDSFDKSLTLDELIFMEAPNLCSPEARANIIENAKRTLEERERLSVPVAADIDLHPAPAQPGSLRRFLVQPIFSPGAFSGAIVASVVIAIIGVLGYQAIDLQPDGSSGQEMVAQETLAEPSPPQPVAQQLLPDTASSEAAVSRPALIDILQDPVLMLEEIRDLRNKGYLEQARALYKTFEYLHPGFRVDPQLQNLLSP